MAQKLASWMRKGSSFLTPSGSSAQLSRDGAFVKASEEKLFTKVDPAVDGEDCDHDCASCSVKYPAKFSIDEEEKLYGQVKGWATHMLVATGKTDWVRDVADEKGSVMEAVDKASKPANGVSTDRYLGPNNEAQLLVSGTPMNLLTVKMSSLNRLTASIQIDVYNFYSRPNLRPGSFSTYFAIFMITQGIIVLKHVTPRR